MSKGVFVKTLGELKEIKNVWVLQDGILKKKAVPKGLVDGIVKTFMEYGYNIIVCSDSTNYYATNIFENIEDILSGFRYVKHIIVDAEGDIYLVGGLSTTTHTVYKFSGTSLVFANQIASNINYVSASIDRSNNVLLKRDIGTLYKLDASGDTSQQKTMSVTNGSVDTDEVSNVYTSLNQSVYKYDFSFGNATNVSVNFGTDADQIVIGDRVCVFDKNNVFWLLSKSDLTTISSTASFFINGAVRPCVDSLGNVYWCSGNGVWKSTYLSTPQRTRIYDGTDYGNSTNILHIGIGDDGVIYIVHEGTTATGNKSNLVSMDNTGNVISSLMLAEKAYAVEPQYPRYGLYPEIW